MSVVSEAAMPAAPVEAAAEQGEAAAAAADAVPFDPIAYITAPQWFDSRLGLERTRELLERLGDPQDSFAAVHVAGTNGKGSTCAMTASILTHAGYKTGLFTSPGIIEFTERVRVDGQNISDADLAAVTLAVREQADAMADHPTEFELMTAVAFLHFARQQCDICVIEVGMGGRLDSTNVLEQPQVCAITPIDLDHMQFLGETLAAIAGEKAGIMKSGVPVVSNVQEPEAAAVLESAAREVGAPLTWVRGDALSGTPRDFSYGSWQNLSIPLLGSYQPSNAALVLEIVAALRSEGWDIPETAVRDGLANVRWPGRFEVVREHPTMIIDGGHNPQGAQALVDSLQLNYPGARPVYLVSLLADKDYPAMLRRVFEQVPGSAYVASQPLNARALPAEELGAAIAEIVGEAPVAVEPDLQQAVACALDTAGDDGFIVAFGSLYAIGRIQSALRLY